MNEAQEKLLRKGIIIVPEEINHDAYQYIAEATLTRRDQIVMFCTGTGGDSVPALAMVDLLNHHNNVIGLLPGEADSSHVAVWMGCKVRYVYPNSIIGVHKVAWSSFNGNLDSHIMRVLATDFDATEERLARLMERESNQTFDFWIRTMRETGSTGVKQFAADEMIEMEMARPIAEFDFAPVYALNGHRPASENGHVVSAVW